MTIPTTTPSEPTGTKHIRLCEVCRIRMSDGKTYKIVEIGEKDVVHSTELVDKLKDHLDINVNRGFDYIFALSVSDIELVLKALAFYHQQDQDYLEDMRKRDVVRSKDDG